MRLNKVWLLLSGCLAFLLVVSCTSKISKPAEEKGRSEIEVTPYKEPGTQQESGVAELPDEVDIGSDIADKKGPKLFSIQVSASDIRKVLQAFARDSKLGIVIDPDVEGMVSVDLKQSTLEEVLFFLLDPLDLDYSREGQVLRISKRRFKTRIFTLNHLLIKRSGKGSIKVSSIEVGKTETGTGEIMSESSSDFWAELETQLKMLVGIDETTQEAVPASAGDKPQGSEAPKPALFGTPTDTTSTVTATESAAKKELETPKLIINRSTGMILVRSRPEVLDVVARFLELVQGSVNRQVRIEAKIAEVVLDDENQFGIRWERFTPFGERHENGSVDLKSGQPLSQNFFSGVIRGDRGRSTAILDAVQIESQVNILSAPSISTLNNQPAIIKVAREEPFFSITETLNAETNTYTKSATKESVTIGVSLRVTPQISDKNVIMMDIHPVITDLLSVREERDNNKVLIISSPVLTVREMNTMVQAKSGETILLAGLIRKKTTQTETKIPLLGDIPFLGELFKSSQIKDEKTELVILLTPTVLIGKSIYEITEKERQFFQQYDLSIYKEL
ncbi:hypothetical protein WDW89_15360 [Deltaproteobacteria bacterium TL4]